MKTKGQHRGHCQACGSIQVVESDGLLAKHGYKVAGFGYFNGVCFGHHYEALEVSRANTDQIIADLRAQAQRNDVRAFALRGGALKPERAHKFTANAREYVWTGEKPHRAREPVMVPWSDASSHERKMQIEQEAGDAESFARHARSHAASLTTLADRVHGKPLIDRAAQELARVNERKAKSAPLVGAFRSKAAQKRELERINREYSQEMQKIIEHTRHNTGERLDIFSIPYDLHAWRDRHSRLVLDTFPSLRHVIASIEMLRGERDSVKGMPVIK